LIDEPAVDQEVNGWLGRLEIGDAERPAPVMPNRFKSPIGVASAAEAEGKLRGFEVKLTTGKRPESQEERENDHG